MLYFELILFRRWPLLIALLFRQLLLNTWQLDEPSVCRFVHIVNNGATVAGIVSITDFFLQEFPDDSCGSIAGE
ncbi:Ephrin type-B receptor [Dirofilaria immitis]